MNDETRQLPLFSLSSDAHSARARRIQRLDPDSECLLAEFVAYRCSDGAAASTARQEAGQLRSLCHVVGVAGRPTSLLMLLHATEALVDHLSGRSGEMSVTTTQARLRALGSFVQFCAARRGIAFTRQLEAIYGRLPGRQPRSWSHAGIVLGGTRGRRTPVGKTLLARDLPLVLAAGPHGTAYRVVRDRALLVCACFTGLRLQELAALSWEQLESNDLRVHIRVRRTVGEIVLSGYGNVLVALGALAARGRRQFGRGYGFGGAGVVFRQSEPPHAVISERQAFAIVTQALVRAGFPRVRQRDVRRAFVHWLTAQGLSEHEAMLAAGIDDARTLDALLEPVRRLNAQRVVAELREAEPVEEATE